MRHHEVDQYAKRSPLRRFDPRVKIASTIVLIIAIAFLRELLPLLVCLAFLLAVVALSRVPLRHVGKSYLLAFPFVVFAALTLWYSSGLDEGVMMFFRISDSVLALIILVTTTPFFELLKALRWFKVPGIISSLLLFTYRFIFIFLDEMERMKLARQARGFRSGRSLLSREALRTIAYTAGMILVRSNTRANNIYDALLSRGYTGEVKTLSSLRAGARDAALAAAFVSVALLSLFIQAGVIVWTL
ncbi:MAG: cobalt ECF transporter T component CbiQ [Euryarchaeota archaeon]|nr:cobalt ECF transporter T component CbiQ [Euryarchaeota archaeon]